MAEETILCKLPVEILVKIGSYMPDLELVRGSQYFKSFEIMCSFKRSFDFSDSTIENEEFIRTLNTYNNKIQSLNVNNCLYLKTRVLKKISKLPNLKELHIIHPGFAPLFVSRSLPQMLEVLSFQWTSSYPFRGNLNYAKELLRNLRYLNIFHCNDGGVDIDMMMFSMSVLRHYDQLKAVKMYGSKSTWTWDEKFKRSLGSLKSTQFSNDNDRYKCVYWDFFGDFVIELIDVYLKKPSYDIMKIE
ncbi:hypothetical protein CHUAL_001298 [Chamberlinius hualienensis]